MLKNTAIGNSGDRFYRQAKIPNLLMIRLKIQVNFLQDYQKAVETADYLLLITGLSTDLVVNSGA